MTELSALHAKITGDSKGLTAELGTARKGVEAFQKSAEASAKVFERAFASSEKSVDSLRRAIDPVYAASKRYEAAVGTLDRALKMGTISQAQYTRLLDQTSAAYLKAQGAATAMGGRLGFLGNMSRETQHKIGYLGMQAQDVAVQLAAGTRATTVFAQQGSQILSVFGPVGSVLGAVAAITLPAIGLAFATAGEKALTFDETIENLRTSVSDLKAITDLYSMEGLEQLRQKYGEVTIEVMRLLEAQRQQALFQAQQDAAEVVRKIAEHYGVLTVNLEATGRAAIRSNEQIANMAEELKISEAEARRLIAAFQQLAQAKTLEEQADALAKIRDLMAAAGIKTGEWITDLTEAEDAIRQANAEGAKAQGWLATATAAAQGWAAALWDAAAGASAVRNAQAAVDPADFKLAGQYQLYGDSRRAAPVTPVTAVSPGRGGGGSGGGGGSNPYQADIDALRQSLLTKEEIELASYAKRQEALKAALDQRMITEEEYRQLSEEAQRQHTDRMAELDVWRYGTGLDKAEAFFGGMASALQGGNERMLAISKKFAAAEALINAHQAASQVLKNPSLPFYAKIPAAMKVLAAGVGMANAIKGGGGGGGGGASGAAGGMTAANSSAPPVQRLLIDYKGPEAAFGSFAGLVDMMNAAGKAGYVLSAEIMGRG